MIQFIKPGINIDFVGLRKIAYSVSLGMILISIISLIIHGGPKYGVDFEGGTLIQVKFLSPVKTDDIKTGLKTLGFGDSSVQQFGNKEENEYQIRTAGTANQEIFDKVKESLKTATGADAEIRGIDMVGPQVSHDLREKALFAVFYTLLFIGIYISGRFELQWVKSGTMVGVLIFFVYSLSTFNVSIPILITAALIITLVLFWYLELKYAMGAIVALIHDVTITVGIFSILGKEINLSIVAALLTIIGYSLNDTIIVFDRIRENLKKYSKNTMEATINRSVNETLSRTILTSLTVLIVVLALLILGGGTIHDFAFAMTIGVVVGTYSSIYVASPILLIWQEYGKKKAI